MQEAGCFFFLFVVKITKGFTKVKKRGSLSFIGVFECERYPLVSEDAPRFHDKEFFIFCKYVC